MGTEVLRPHDCLTRRPPSLFPRRRPNPNPNPSQRSFRKPSSAHPRKRREGSPNQAKPGAGVAGRVTILKRGESLDSGMARMRREEAEAELFGTGRLGPDPAAMRIRMAAGGSPDPYAGTAFEQSPSPRALPLPRFAFRVSAPAVDSSATADLRRLLRLG